jgi:hypothetical protein
VKTARCISLASVDEVTWRKPRSIAITIVWGVTNAFIALQAFLGGRENLAWFDLLFIFFVAVFAGALLADVKTVILGIFESIFLSVAIMYLCLILPVIVGNVAGYYQANVVYTMSVNWVFWAFFPLTVFSCFLGAIVGLFVEDLIL